MNVLARREAFEQAVTDILVYTVPELEIVVRDVVDYLNGGQ